MKVKILDLENIEEIELIEKSCFAQPWSQSSIKQSIINGNYFFGVFLDNILCGYGSMNVVFDEGYINNIAVLNNHRKKGLGKAIINKMIAFGSDKKLSFLSLEVRQSNEIAIKLYSSAGFKWAGQRKNYYTSPLEDALILTKYFNKEETEINENFSN